MPTILITGANRGLGLEFARSYAADGWRVIACCREPARAAGLKELAGTFPGLEIHSLDVADLGQIDTLAERLSGTAIDILLSNAGVYGDRSGFGQLDYAAWGEVFRVNTMAAAKLAEAFVDAVGRSDRRLIAAMSSLMGSMADNGSGGAYLYRSSKAALNAVMKSLAVDLRPRGIGVLVLHPGWVRTDMGGPGGLIDTTESVRGLRARLDGFKAADSGRFLNYDGTELPW